MKKSLLTMAAALALVSCSQDDLMQGIENRPTGAIGVNTFVARGTRGVAFNNADEFEATSNGFDLFAFQKASDGTFETNPFMSGVEFQYNDGWDYADKGEIKFWQQVESGNTVDFYAVSPANTTTLNIASGAQTIDYTVAALSADQKDLMYAKTIGVNPTDETIIKNGVHIDFYHALSQIVFKAKVHEDYASYINATVAGVEIVNLHNQGTFTFANAGFGDFTKTYTPWSDVTGTADYVAEVATAGVAVNAALNTSEAVDLTTSSTALLLMPQEITGATLADNKTAPTGEGTYIKVTCKVYYKGTNDTEATQIVGENDETAVIYIPLTTTWQAGWKYIYTLVFSDDVADPVTINEDLYVGPWHEDHNDHKELPEELAMSYDAQNNAFRIYTAKDLATIRDYVNSGASYSVDGEGNITTTVTRATVTGTYVTANYMLMADIDLSDYDNWDPIGTNDSPFSGTFKGKNKTISNLKINNDKEYQGLFGYVKPTDSDPIVIENLNVSGNITANRYIGGIAGYLYGYPGDNTITIENCSFSGNITSTNTTGNEMYVGRASTGGIVGAVAGDNNINLVNCKNYASIKASNYNIGGIVGFMCNANIISCQNEGNVNIAKENQRYAGGIVGQVQYGANIIKCINNGSVKIDRGSLGCTSWYAGGIIGMVSSNGNINVVGCFNTAEIIAQTYEAGIVGFSADNIISCYNTGKINDSGAFGAGYWGTIAQGVTNGSANYYGGSCTSSGKADHYNGEAFSADDYSDEITAMNEAIQEFAQTCEDEFIKSHLANLRYKLNEDELTKAKMPLIFE